MPKSKRERPHVSPAGLADRLDHFGALHSRALLRQTFGELTDASDVLERVAEALRLLDETASANTEDGTAYNDNEAERPTRSKTKSKTKKKAKSRR